MTVTSYFCGKTTVNFARSSSPGPIFLPLTISIALFSPPAASSRCCHLVQAIVVTRDCHVGVPLVGWPRGPPASSESQQAIMANPRKFSEKIALHNQKQAEETAAFEAILREVSATTRVRVGVGVCGRVRRKHAHDWRM